MSLPSIFEILGPVIMGPSSSHTGAAYRMGAEAFSLLGQEPAGISITLYNSYARTCRGHMTHVAMVGGCMGLSEKDPDIKQVLRMAEQKGIPVEIKVTYDDKEHPNRADIRIRSCSGKEVLLSAVSIGGGAIRVLQPDGPSAIQQIPVINGPETFSDLLEIAREQEKSLARVILVQEGNAWNCSEQEILSRVSEILEVMKESVKRGIEGDVFPLGGMSDRDAMKVYGASRKILKDPVFSKAIAYALAVNEVNASMGIIAAAPTGGACGILPGVLIAVKEERDIPEEELLLALVTAGGIGSRIARQTSLSASVAGCQVEIGVAAAMTAGALTQMVGGTPGEVIDASAMALKSYLGLACDAIAGLVEVPCIKRNGTTIGTVFSASQMALAGVESQVPMDQVVWALADIGGKMPLYFRDTMSSGLAMTKKGREIFRKVYGEEKKTS